MWVRRGLGSAERTPTRRRLIGPADPAELYSHTLLIDDGSRHRSYCLILLGHVDVGEADLRAQAATYGLDDEIDALRRYLETHGEVDDDRLPEYEGFQELAADYVVPLPR